MFKLIWNLLALLGLVIVAGIVVLGVQQGSSIMNLKDFDPKSAEVYMNMAKTLIETGNAAEATVWKLSLIHISEPTRH